MLKHPVLALSSDRTKKAQWNNLCGDPADWFDSSFFRQYGIYGTTFDFFVDWENERISDEVWIKRISDSSDIQCLSEEALIELISECDGREKSRSLFCFLSSQNMLEKYMLFRDVEEDRWADGTEKVVELDLSRFGKDSVSYLDAAQIQERIRQLRKQPASIGSAGLIYATSSLEGYLSKQEYFWPGDVDTVLYDRENRVLAILEFKKHTYRSKIPFKDQRLENYLLRDYLKYKSLAMLRDRFHTKLFVLYYPIPPSITYIIIEEVKGTPDRLFAGRREEYPLPMKRDMDCMNAFAEKFVRDILKS